MSDHNDMPSRSVERDAQDNGYGGYELDPEQFEDILNSTEATSIDYNTVRTLVEGTVDRWLGFKFIRSERLEVDGSSNQAARYPRYRTSSR